MTIVRRLLTEKSGSIESITMETSVFSAVALLSEKNLGALLVMDNDRLVGVLSERDCVRRILLKKKSSTDTQVKEIMTKKVSICSPEYTVEDCMAIMTEKRVRHLPVIEDDKVIGVISIGDLVKSLVAQKDFVIEQLEKYIYGPDL